VIFTPDSDAGASLKVVAVGECTRDRYLDRGLETVGGISVNFAVNSRRCGASRAAVVSGTGTDPAAVLIRAKLAREGVDAARLHTMPGSTATQLIRLGPGGERIFPAGGYDPGVLSDFRLGPADLAFIGTFDLVAAPFFRQINHLFGPAIQAAGPGARRVVDVLDGADLGADLVGIEPLLDQVDLVFLSGPETAVERLFQYSRHTSTVIVVTHGAGGSTGLAGGRKFRAAALEVPESERIDTTGCGDAFQAGFSIEYFQRGDLPSALIAGATRASQVIRHIGATGE